MNPSDNPRRGAADRELDDYLDGRHRLSAQYRAASRETTTPELDRAVLDRARAAAATTPPRPARPSWQQRWAVPVGIAATLVVGVDLAWRVADHRQAQEQADVAAASVPLSEAPSARVMAERAADETAPFDQGAGAGAELERRRTASPAAPAPVDEVEAFAQQAPAVAPAVGVAPAMRDEAAADAMADAVAVQRAAPSEAAVSEGADAQALSAMSLADLEQAQAEIPREETQLAARKQAVATAKARAVERNDYAPPAAAFAAPPPEPPAPRRDAEAARLAAADVVALLRATDYERLRQQYAAGALTRRALEEAGAVISALPPPRLTEEADGTWRADYLDGDGRLRCALRLRSTADARGWQLVGLATRP